MKDAELEKESADLALKLTEALVNHSKPGHSADVGIGAVLFLNMQMVKTLLDAPPDNEPADGLLRGCILNFEENTRRLKVALKARNRRKH